MLWIYLSPHLDDVSLSCGGLIWEQTQAGDEVAVWTVCAGDPPAGALSPFALSLHTRWKTGDRTVGERRAEDIRACARLGATAYHFPIPDCIYRLGEDGGPIYLTEESLFGPLHPKEEPLVAWLSQELLNKLPDQARLVCPLAFGGHVDHRLVRAAVEHLPQFPLYYADYPYVLRESHQLERMGNDPSWQPLIMRVSEEGLKAWEDSITAYTSQISSFWPELEAMRTAIRSYYRQTEAIRLWRRR